MGNSLADFLLANTLMISSSNLLYWKDFEHDKYAWFLIGQNLCFLSDLRAKKIYIKWKTDDLLIANGVKEDIRKGFSLI